MAERNEIVWVEERQRERERSKGKIRRREIDGGLQK